MRKCKPEYVWDEETKSAICILTNGEQAFVGTSKCHEDDWDLGNKNTGCEIAFKRASIKYLRYLRDTYRTRLEALNQLYYSMNTSKKFNPNSYENKMLQRQIQLTEFDFDITKQYLAHEEQGLREYLRKKDEFYHKIRRYRKERAE